MSDFTKAGAIRTLEKHGWNYHGFLDAGWGEKFYTFSSPEKKVVEMRLRGLRQRAHFVNDGRP